MLLNLYEIGRFAASIREEHEKKNACKIRGKENEEKRRMVVVPGRRKSERER